MNWKFSNLFICCRSTDTYIAFSCSSLPEPILRCPSANTYVKGLSLPKTLPRSFQPERPVRTEIPPPAVSSSQPRNIDALQTLATPRRRPTGLYREPVWLVSKNSRFFLKKLRYQAQVLSLQVKEDSLKATPSSRVVEIAQPKSNVDGFVLNLVEPVWPITRSARNAVASDRVSQLANPVVRPSMDHVLFNPKAFQVNELALKATCSARTAELAMPIVRWKSVAPDFGSVKKTRFIPFASVSVSNSIIPYLWSVVVTKSEE